jgi:transcriptional regulator with XRE-family HTH domain
MGHARRRPKRLAEKVLQIRTTLGLSRSEMVERLGIEMPYTNVSKYERDKSEPPIEVLLAHARAANVQLEQIVDDDQDLRLSVLNPVGVHRTTGRYF